MSHVEESSGEKKLKVIRVISITSLLFNFATDFQPTDADASVADCRLCIKDKSFNENEKTIIIDGMSAGIHNDSMLTKQQQGENDNDKDISSLFLSDGQYP